MRVAAASPPAPPRVTHAARALHRTRAAPLPPARPAARKPRPPARGRPGQPTGPASVGRRVIPDGLGAGIRRPFHSTDVPEAPTYAQNYTSQQDHFGAGCRRFPARAAPCHARRTGLASHAGGAPTTGQARGAQAQTAGARQARTADRPCVGRSTGYPGWARGGDPTSFSQHRCAGGRRLGPPRLPPPSGLGGGRRLLS